MHKIEIYAKLHGGGKVNTSEDILRLVTPLLSGGRCCWFLVGAAFGVVLLVTAYVLFPPDLEPEPDPEDEPD